MRSADTDRDRRYEQWGESNDVVVVYPQASWGLGNLGGCWDWWGITGRDFDTKNGGQLSTVLAMVADLPNAFRSKTLPANRTLALSRPPSR